jgi:adenosylcobyric acid synthase
MQLHLPLSELAKIFQADGCISANTHVLGSYLHGLFDDDNFRHQFIAAARSFYSLNSPASVNPWKAQRKSSFDRLSIAVGQSLDLSSIFGWADLSYRLAPSSIEGVTQR